MIPSPWAHVFLGITCGAALACGSPADPAVERCEAGEGAACWEAAERIRGRLGPFARDTRQLDEAARLTRRACELDTAAACASAAAHSARTGRPDRARAFGQRACDRGFGDGCLTLAQALDADDPAAAEAARARGCDHGCARCCFQLAQAAETPEAATALFVRSCEARDEDVLVIGCETAGLRLARSDRERAIALLDRACVEWDTTHACGWARRLRLEGPPAPGSVLVPEGSTAAFQVGAVRLTPPAGHRGVRRDAREAVVLLSEPGCRVHWIHETRAIPSPIDLWLPLEATRREGVDRLQFSPGEPVTIGGRRARTWTGSVAADDDALGEPRQSDVIVLAHGSTAVIGFGSFPEAVAGPCRDEMMAHAATLR